MLRVETHKNLRDPRSFEASRVLIRDQYDNPVVLVISDDAFIHIHQVGDPDFDTKLREHGVDRTVIVTDLQIPENHGPRIQ